MRIYAYQVISKANVVPIEALLNNIKTMSLKKRTKNIASSVIRIEDVEKKSAHIWVADFVKWLTRGPGKAHLEKKFEGIRLERDYKFASETGILYDSTKKIMLIEYNHTGAREGSISDYLSIFSGNPLSYTLKPIIDFDIDNKWANSGKLTKLEYSIADLNTSDEKRYKNNSISETIALQKRFLGDKITISINADRSNEEGIDKVESSSLVSMLRSIITLGSKKENKQVKKLEVTAKNEESGISDIIDFITPKLCVEVDITVGDDQRYPQEIRWASLLQAHKNWKSSGSYDSSN